MKLRLSNIKMKHIKQILAKRLTTGQSILALLVISVLTAGIVTGPIALADQFDAQIQAIQTENARKANQKQQLLIEASSFEAAIAQLQSQIDTLEAQIRDNQAKNEALQKQIKAAEEELARQKKLLGENIKAMYLEGDISTLEMLASSRDLGEFVDKQQYRNSVKDKIRNTLDRVTALKLELKSQKEKLDKLIADQKTMQGQLALQRAEQDRLLNLNSEQRAALDSEMQANNSRIAELRQQQAIENAKHFRGVTIIPGHNGRDTYPDVWRNSPQDSMIDSWGMYNRECVSYTAWKVYSTGRYMPYWGGIGNANQWDDNARRMGIPVDTNPRPGDVAIAHWGYYGHAMYVESVNPDGTINISQYNWDFNGTYSEAYNFSTAGLVFIHFQ
jgi:surface antigen